MDFEKSIKIAKAWYWVIVVLMAANLGLSIAAVRAQNAEPVVSPENHAKIRDLQRQQDKLVITALQLQKQQEELQKQYVSVSAQLETAMTKAMTDAKADPKYWTLDPETLNPKKNPAPPPPPKTEEKKKP